MPSDNTKRNVAYGIIGAAAVAYVANSIHQSSKAADRKQREQEWSRRVREADNEGQPIIADKIRESAREEGFNV
jgi:hypothetical protein